MTLSIRWDIPHTKIQAIVCQGHLDASKASSDELQALVAERLQKLLAEPEPADKWQAVRQAIRAGGFKPSGRSKPASEYLWQAAQEQRFPTVSAAVDVLNLVSVSSRWPISLVDASAFGSAVAIRLGAAGETYAFNASGHSMDLEGLMCVCRQDGDVTRPLANPIKDSMTAKLSETSRDFLAVLYVPSDAHWTAAASVAAEELSSLLQRFAGATSVAIQRIPST